MSITVRFAKVNLDLHTSMKAASTLLSMRMGVTYTKAMEDLNKTMKRVSNQRFWTETTIDKPVRVECIDEEVYKQFKITCILQGWTTSEGINLALKDWLDINASIGKSMSEITN